MSKFKLIFSCILILPGFSFAQAIRDSGFVKVRNVAGTLPVSKNTRINGLGIGLYANIWNDKKADLLQINGMGIAFSPVDPLLAMYFLAYSAPIISRDSATLARRTHANHPHKFPDSVRAKGRMNGVLLSSFGMVQAEINGLNISAAVNTTQKMNGLSVSSFFNHMYDFNGVLIAGLRNKTTKGKGLQIALFNVCKEGKVVQIGLVNRIGKRTLPFVNCRLSGSKKNFPRSL